MACTSHASSNAELAAKINSVLSTADETPPLQLWNTVLGILKEYNMPYELEAMDPNMLLPHPKNRGGSMLHPFNSHKVGLKVKKAGADFKELTKQLALRSALILALQRSSLLSMHTWLKHVEFFNNYYPLML